MKVFVWLCALVAGLFIGAMYQRSVDERDFLLKVERVRVETIKANARCDEAVVGIAESILLYKGVTK